MSFSFGRRALSETTTFWSIHRNWTFAAGPISTLAYKGISQGWKSLMTDWLGSAISAAFGFLVAWGGTYLINLMRAPSLVRKDMRKELEQLKDGVKNLLFEGPRLEIAGAFDLLAGEADNLADSLNSMRFEVKIETHPEVYAVVNSPLDNENLDLFGDRAKWCLMHYRVWQFQQLYAGHFKKVFMERMDTGFESFVTHHPINARESTTAVQVVEGLGLHAKALRDQAAKLRDGFSASATISPTVHT